MSEGAAKDARTSARIRADRHLYDYLREKLCAALERTHRLEMHFRRPDAPDLYEYRLREGDGPPLFLEVTQKNYDAYVLRLKGGRPGEARRAAVAALKDALLGVADAFALDVDPARGAAQREAFARAVDRIAAELVESE